LFNMVRTRCSVHLFTWARRVSHQDAQGQTKKMAEALSSIHQRRVTQTSQGSADARRTSNPLELAAPLSHIQLAALYVHACMAWR
jgi:hypothetical protein